VDICCIKMGRGWILMYGGVITGIGATSPLDGSTAGLAGGL